MNAPIHEEVASKLWELLRRNTRFALTVSRFAVLKDRVQSGSRRAAQLAHHTGCRVIHRLGEHFGNPFAATALQWLLPDPTFYRWELDLINDSVFTRRLAVGIVPDRASKVRWRSFEAGPRARAGEQDAPDDAAYKAVTAGRAWRWGPGIHTYVSENQGLLGDHRGDFHDGIAEWQRDKPQPLTLGTRWEEAPEGFRRAFGMLALALCGGSKPRQTDFFEGWNLGEVLRSLWNHDSTGRAIMDALESMPERSNRRPGEPRVRSLASLVAERVQSFGLLSWQRVVTIPRVLRRSDADALFKLLKRQIRVSLPNHLPLGSPGCWTTLLAVEKIERTLKLGRKEAVRAYVRAKHVPPALRKAEADMDPYEKQAMARWVSEGEMLPSPQNRSEAKQWKIACRQFDRIAGEELRLHTGRVQMRLKYLDSLISATFPCLGLRTLKTRSPR